MSEQFYSSVLNTSTRKKRRKGQRMKPEQRIAAQAMFLAAYERTANVLAAAEQAEIDRTLVYYWQEHDEPFGFAFNLADEAANKRIEAEIRRRAIEGWDEPLVSAGKRVGTVRKYSDTLLIFYAKRRMPEYREKSQVDVHSTAQAGDTQALYDAVERIFEPYPEQKWKLAEALAELEKTRKP